MQTTVEPGATLRALAPLTGFLRIVEARDAEPGWIDREALQRPDDGPLAALLEHVAAPEIAEH